MLTFIEQIGVIGILFNEDTMRYESHYDGISVSHNSYQECVSFITLGQ